MADESDDITRVIAADLERARQVLAGAEEHLAAVRVVLERERVALAERLARAKALASTEVSEAATEELATVTILAKAWDKTAGETLGAPTEIVAMARARVIALELELAAARKRISKT